MASAERQAQDHAFMRRALDLARQGWGQTAPNPMVGAVVVASGEVVGEGYHARFGAAHAEIGALSAAGERARGATLYVTLEPCAHIGKTPPCTDAILRAGIARIVIALRDPNPAATGGAERLRGAGLSVDIGVEEAEARELNAPFFRTFEDGSVSSMPWVVLKLALSLDGALADAQRSPGWLTGASARREVHRMRAGADAIAVGIGTVLADDPELTVREGTRPRVQPRRIIFDTTARTPLEARVVRSAGEIPTTIVVRDGSLPRAARLREAGTEILEAESLSQALTALASSGVRSLLVEGGARLAGAFLRDRLVDRLVIFQAPLILGAGALNAFAYAPAVALGRADRLRIVSRRTFGEDSLTTYAFGSSTVSCSPG